MIREFQKHLAHYLILLLLLGIHLAGFLAFWPNKTAQQVMAISLGLTYFLWGYIHHLLTHSMHRRVMLEYFFVSIFATAVLILLVQ